MYSRNKGMTDRDFTLTPPPGYDGSRFRRRSDGRDDAYPLYSDRERRQDMQERPRRGHITYQPEKKAPREEPCPLCDASEEQYVCSPEEEPSPEECKEQTTPAPLEKSEKKSENGVISFLQSLGSEDILLIALIVLLAGGESRVGMETVLILALLLCIR